MFGLCESPCLSTTMRPSLSATVRASSKPSMCIRGDDVDADLLSAITHGVTLPPATSTTTEFTLSIKKL